MSNINDIDILLPEVSFRSTILGFLGYSVERTEPIDIPESRRELQYFNCENIYKIIILNKILECAHTR